MYENASMKPATVRNHLHNQAEDFIIIDNVIYLAKEI